MLPEITEALIAQAIQTPRMVEAGRDYCNRGRVRQLSVASERNEVRAFVEGSGENAYEVGLHFGKPAASRLMAQCSCPVGLGCKHAAAALFALRAELERSRRTQGAFQPLPSPPAQLPPALSQWLGAMRPLMREANVAAEPATRATYYVLRAQALTSSARMSAKRSAASLTEPGRPLRLFVDVQDVTLDGEGRPVGAGGKIQPHQAFQVAAGSVQLSVEDQLIIRRLNARLGETDHEGCLAGVGGFDLLTRMVATGRARWGNARGPTLGMDSPTATTLRWSHDRLGHAFLSLGSEPQDRLLALVAPPVLIDPVSGRIAPVETGVPAVVAEQLLRLPAVAPDAIAALASRWSEAAPPGVPPPVPPDVRDLGRLQPAPVVSLITDRVQVEEWSGSRWGRGRRVKLDCAVARLTFDYGAAVIDAAAIVEEKVLLRDDEGLVRFSRDLAAEAQAFERLVQTDLMPVADFEGVDATPAQEWDFAPGLPASADEFTSFLLRDAEILRGEGWRVDIAANFPLQLAKAETDSLEVTLAPSGIDWFDMELGAIVDGQRIDLVPALNRLLSMLTRGEADELMSRTFKPGEVLPVALGDGRVVTVDAERLLPMLRALVLLASHAPGAAAEGRPRIARQDLGLLAALETVTGGLPWSGAEPLRKLARALSELRLAPTALPPGFKASLRPYQQTGLDWLDALGRAGFGGLLADDMGLGKTVQTLAHLSVLKARGELERPALIVAPTSVLPNWQAEAARFTPDLSVLLLHGPDRHGRHDHLADHPIVLTSYPLLVRDLPQLAKVRFGLIVFDEAHNLKNPRTASHAAARALAADRKIALTGTPVENRLTDAWALFDILTPGLLGSQREFARDYRALNDATGDPAARARLARKLRPFLLRRTKEAVATDLPPKSVVPLSITLTPAQMALHESQRLLMHERVRSEIARVGLMRAQIIVLTALTRLRQICCDPRLIQGGDAEAAPSAKLERLLELLEELIPEGRRIILFSQFTSMLDLIKPELDRLGVAWTELTGATRDRKAPVARFQSGEVPLILVSLKAGGTGLNLTAADTVVLYDPWWNPAIEAQAVDRAHRIGQTKPVFVYRMVAAGTIEEKILALQARKAALANTLWSEDPAKTSSLSEDDIAFLLS